MAMTILTIRMDKNNEILQLQWQWKIRYNDSYKLTIRYNNHKLILKLQITNDNYNNNEQ